MNEDTKVHDEKEKNLFEVIKNFVDNLEKEIELERESRLKEEDMLLNWLENATSKLNLLSLI